MTVVFRSTLAELTDPGGILDLQAGSMGFAEDSDSVVLYKGNGIKIVGPSGAPTQTGSSTFFGLTDTPPVENAAALEGKWARLIGGEVVFEDLPPSGGGSTVESFLDLEDTPDDYSGAEGKWARVVGDQIVFEDLPPSGGGTLPNLSLNQAYIGSSSSLPVAASAVAVGNVLWRGPAGLGFSPLPIENIQGFPAFSGNARKVIAVNTTGDGLFALPYFFPPTYNNNAGRSVRVNSLETGFEYFDREFKGMLDTPPDYTGAAGRFVRVNDNADGLDFLALGAVFTLKGPWDASPGTAPSPTPSEGDFYTVSVAGTFESVAYGTDDAIYFAASAWHKQEGGMGAGGGGVNRIVDLLDTVNLTPTEGQGYVYDPTALPGDQPGFGLQTFVRASVSDYTARRILVTDGTSMVDQPYFSLPEGTSTGQLAYWNDASSSWQLVGNGGSGSVLASGTPGQAPIFAAFGDLYAEANIEVPSLATANQTLTGDRIVEIDTNSLSIGKTGQVSLSMDGVNGTLNLFSRNNTIGTTLMNVSNFGIDVLLVGQARLRFWDDSLSTPAYSTGEPGMQLVSFGSAGPAKWGWGTVRSTSPDGTVWELGVSDAGVSVWTVAADTSTDSGVSVDYGQPAS